MAHYAFINNNNIVVEVIVGRDENDLIDGIDNWETYYQNQRDGFVCKRTSYNTYLDENGVSQHYGAGEPFRGTYAGIGYSYDPISDTFVPPAAEEEPDENERSN